MRYIDAEALTDHMLERYNELCEKYGDWDHYATGYGDAIDAIENAPEADVVEVVRCKDCVSFNGEICSYHSDLYGEHEVMVEADDYCSYGRREW